MIPYFQYNSILFGPIAIQVWGIFVSLGLLAAVIFAYRLARRYFLSGEVMLDLAVWVLLGGFLLARIFHVVFYEPAYYIVNPLDTFKFWQGGASSLGGFIGAGLAGWLFFKKRHFKLKEVLPYLDIGVLSLWLGWGIGRLGCFMIHDHPGRLSNLFLAVNFSGGARYDLGLLESLLAFLLFISYFLLFKKIIRIHWGLVAIFSLMDYALIRFLFDFLRATDLPQSDIRYWLFTPAQWGMGFLFIILTVTLICGIRGRNVIGKEVESS